ncbi:hypothetical protein EDB86DRAFT_2974417 [Lactarius hatsudake]|nr:hypothetical protein EDB86DRAFT_2974417 [Lactarius hatsudake]
MDTVGGPDAKKARWSPNSFGAPPQTVSSPSPPVMRLQTTVMPPRQASLRLFLMALRLPAFPDSAIPPPLTRPLETWLGLASPGNYSGAALTAAVTASNNAAGRTVYVGNLPTTASVDKLLNLVHLGPLEPIRILPETSCVFLSFLAGSTAGAFHADATIKKLSLHGHLPGPQSGCSCD